MPSLPYAASGCVLQRWVTGVFPPSSEYWYPRSPIQPQCTASELRSQKLIPCSPIHSNERDRRSDNQRLESEGCVESQRPWAKSFALGLQLSTHEAGISGAWLEDCRPKRLQGAARKRGSLMRAPTPAVPACRHLVGLPALRGHFSKFPKRTWSSRPLYEHPDVQMSPKQLSRVVD